MPPVALPTGPFTCEIVLQRVRAPHFVREDKQGITYMTARDYELAYETTLHFSSGAELRVTATLVGELNQRLVVRDAQGRPVAISGYVQGTAEVRDAAGHAIFRGRYYDSRVIQPLAGDAELTPAGQAVVDHCENGFGEGAYAGHAFSVSAQLTREGENMPRGQARGHID
jgi:hypothetical protein